MSKHTPAARQTARRNRATKNSSNNQTPHEVAEEPTAHGLSQNFLDRIRPYYLGDDSGSQKARYVLWVDIMGSQGKMLRNVRTAAIPLMKLHIAALAAKKKTLGGIQLFPVIDGIYVVSEHFSSIAFFLSDVFRSMAAEFLVLKNWERSVIRGAVAYGPVILGEECKSGSLFLKESDYANGILLGMPLVQAYTAERDAPPFGVFVHESVRAFGQMGQHSISTPLWRWWSKNTENSQIAFALLPCLRNYFDWSRSNPVSSGYPADRIEVHKVLAEEYLGEFKDGWKAKIIAASAKTTGDQLKPKRNLSHLEKQLKKLRERLDLREEQIEQIKPILSKRDEDLKALEQNRALDREERRLMILNVVAESKVEIQALLDDAQRETLIESGQGDSVIQDEE